MVECKNASGEIYCITRDRDNVYYLYHKGADGFEKIKKSKNPLEFDNLIFKDEILMSEKGGKKKSKI